MQKTLCAVLWRGAKLSVKTIGVELWPYNALHAEEFKQKIL